MSQSRLQSFVESNANTFIGFVGSWLLMHFLINPLYNMHASAAQTFGVTCIFTVWSIIRGYCVRRYFNWRHSGNTSGKKL